MQKGNNLVYNFFRNGNAAVLLLMIPLDSGGIYVYKKN